MQDHPRDFPYSTPLPESSGPNRNNPSAGLAHLASPAPFLAFNHHHHRPSPPSPAAPHNPPASYPSSSPPDRDALFLRHPPPASSPHQPAPTTTASLAARSTLWWGELEPWMDEAYAKQVCDLMKWDPVSIKVPHPAPNPATGQQPNNPGYCFLTFPSPSQAASVLAQVANGQNGGPVPMPNSAKPFVMNWASSVISATSPMAASFPAVAGPQPAAAQQYPKEYSIFVGDLAPETSNSDLVAVFRNPVLGLRNDREPKFITPFYSCKSAKIMLDPLTGVSRGYGFVRFTDEADQQRALIEMHGLYCLSRPMRISPATAKFKAPAALPSFDLSSVHFPPPAPQAAMSSTQMVPGYGLPNPIGPVQPQSQTKSVSAPIAATGSNMSLNSNAPSNTATNSSIGGSHSSNSLSSGTGSSTSLSNSSFMSSGTDDMAGDVLARLAQQYGGADSAPSPFKLSSASPYLQEAQMRQALGQQGEDPASRYMISEESWKHHAQARAILGNLIGPNGEQLTSTDPYNTTVFVGGLSPLISEETLRTFFVPFGDIHYVKVPVGKHCGFVQFVRKADAEMAIEKMQGFPIGGSRIRLSWGRSQYKAAQAAAQAAQSAAIQSQFNPPPLAPSSNSLTQEQALAILQKFTAQGYFQGAGSSAPSDMGEIENALLNSGFGHAMLNDDEHQQNKRGHPILQHTQQQRQQQQQSQQNQHQEDAASAVSSAFAAARPELHRAQSNFSPFSPEPGSSLYMTSSESTRRDSYARLEALPHPSKAYAPGFFPVPHPHHHELKVNTGAGGGGQGGGAGTKISPGPASGRSSAGTLYTFSESSDPPAPLNRAPGRSEAPISRPASSGQAGRGEAGDADIQDLNGTLASLDLDRERPWRAAEGAGSRSG
ncbi:RNA-binding protein Csx1 [Pholiota molesta]|nr:RNA-binding protein Csx1 [Pholiota molesta]